jgi:hypothetical protein
VARDVPTYPTATPSLSRIRHRRKGKEPHQQGTCTLRETNGRSVGRSIDRTSWCPIPNPQLLTQCFSSRTTPNSWSLRTGTNGSAEPTRRARPRSAARGRGHAARTGRGKKQNNNFWRFLLIPSFRTTLRKLFSGRRRSGGVSPTARGKGGGGGRGEPVPARIAKTRS